MKPLTPLEESLKVYNVKNVTRLQDEIIVELEVGTDDPGRIMRKTVEALREVMQQHAAEAVREWGLIVETGRTSYASAPVTGRCEICERWRDRTLVGGRALCEECK